MTTLLLLVLCALTPSALADCSVQRAQPQLQRSTYEFAVQLTTRIAQEKNNHFVASTFSIWGLLATASLGADGQTLDEFRKVLGLHRDQCFNDRYFELVRSLTDGNFTIEKSSLILTANMPSIKDGFLRSARNAGVGEIVAMSIDDLEMEAIPATISQYVSRATHGKITDLVSPVALVDFDLLLIDALYFKGLWQMPFPYEDTQRRPFYNDAGVKVGEVDLMRVEGTFKLNRVSVPDTAVLELPFGADGRLAMLVFLPRPSTTLSTVIESLARVSLTTIYTEFKRGDKEFVLVQLPRFEMTSQLDNLRELLGDMGLRAAFGNNAAEFPLLSSDLPFYISHGIQKVTLSVSEAGAEASPAAAGLDLPISGPTIFHADKPFLYMIVDTVTEVPLLTGAYSRPN